MRDLRARKKVHRHVTAPAEGRAKLLHYQENLTIVGAGIVLRFDVHRSCLAGVSATVQVASCGNVRMVEAKTRRFWHKRDSAHAVGRHERCPFLNGAIHLAWDHLSMPV